MLKGIFTPIITVFDGQGRPDFKGNEKIIDRLIAGGVDGILFLGSIGEFYNFTAEEKKEFIRFAAGYVAGRTRVLVGTGGTVAEEVMDLTEYAQSQGADAAVVISPYYFKLDEEQLYTYYSDIASRTDMPILMYNFPDRTAVDLSPELVLRLAGAHRNIIGIKDTVDNISHTRRLIRTVKPYREDFSIFSGFDEYLVPNLMAGGDGAITGLTNIAPSLFARLYRAFQKNDFPAVLQLHRSINTLMALYQVSQPFIASIKAAVSLLVDGISPQMRKPACELSEDQLAKIRQIMDEIGDEIQDGTDHW